MTRLATLLLYLTAVLGLASCSTPTPVIAEPTPVPPHAYAIEQRTLGDKTQFVACAECERLTPKTLRVPRPRLAVTAPGGTTLAATETPAQAVKPAQMPQGTAQATSPPAPTTRTELFTVVFDLNSAALTRAARSRLDALVPLANAAGRVRVVGYTDDLGSQGLNNRLSDQRALAVMLYLRDRLTEPRPDLSATGRPLCCYVTDNRSEDHRAPNRRAEIAVEVLDTPAVRALLLSARARMVGSRAPAPNGSASPDEPHRAQAAAQLAQPQVNAQNTVQDLPDSPQTKAVKP